MHCRSSSQFLIAPAFVAPGTDLCCVFETSLEDLGKGRYRVTDSRVLALLFC